MMMASRASSPETNTKGALHMSGRAVNRAVNWLDDVQRNT